MQSYRELHDELRCTARDLLAKDTPDWRLLGELGWPGLEVPESCGGAGASFAETAVILEEIGRAAATTAFLGGAVLTVGTLTALRAGDVPEDLLARVAGTQTRMAVALPADGSIEPLFGFDGQRVSGRAEFVPDAHGAAALLLLARDPDGAPVIVNAPAEALEVITAPVLDETRCVAEVSASGAPGVVLRFDGDPQAAVARIFDRARLAVACDSLGLAEAMLGATVDYAKVRYQFGRAIGSFQAVKHACADMLVDLRVGRRLVGAAIEAVVTGDPDASTAVLMAKAAVCGSAVDIVGKAMQLHGGIGYTWEHGIHVYLKRAALNRALFGTPAAHRRQLALRYL